MTTVRASCFSASRCAAVAPTLPAPTTVILFNTSASPSPGVHLSMGIGAEAVQGIQGTAFRQRQALLGAAVGAPVPGVRDRRGQSFVRRTAAQRGAEIDAPLSVEAQEPGAVGGEAAAITAAAERRR